uniref:Uncharacterized protein n=1 Tax=Brassica oleracea var. oleracea TaxID=109376 RepID=A0A0D3CA53_BRAOL
MYTSISRLLYLVSSNRSFTSFAGLCHGASLSSLWIPIYLVDLAAKTAPVQPTCAESSAEENLVLAVGSALKKYLLKLST